MSSLFSVSALSLLGTTLFPIWLLQGLERLKLAAAAMGISRLLTIPAIMLLVKRPQDVILAAAIQASVELVASAVVAPCILPCLRAARHWPTVSNVVRTYKEAWPLFLSGAALFLVTYSTTAILGSVSSAAEVGYFSAADKLIKAPIAALNPLSQALYPHTVSARIASSYRALRLLRKTLLAMRALSTLASAATLFLAVPVCRVLLGGGFQRSTIVLQCMAPLPVLFGLLNVFGTQTMLVFGMDSKLTRILFACALVGLPVAVLMSFVLGSVGAAMASVVTMILIVTAMYVCLRRNGFRLWSMPVEQAPPSVVTSAGD